MAVGGIVLSLEPTASRTGPKWQGSDSLHSLGTVVPKVPLRTCVGCKKVDAQSALVRLTMVGSRLVLDHPRRAPGRGVYVHRRTSCVEAAARGGLARSLRLRVPPDDLRRIATDLSQTDDNSPAQLTDGPIASAQNAAGLDRSEAVETPPRTDGGAQGKDDRREDAGL